jgi:hypothetical protein
MANGTLKVSNIQTSSGSGTITIGQSGETVTVASGVTQTVAVNTPSFSAYMGSDQNSVADATWTKVNMNTEFFDSDGKYDTSNYRFTPTVAGKYMFGASLYYNSSNTMETGEIGFYKNGSKLLYASNDVNDDNKHQLTGIIDLDTDDYVELYAYVNVASGGTFNINQDGTTSNNRCYWYGYKIIGA